MKFFNRISRKVFGTTKVINANISYLNPSKKLEGKKIVVTGGNKGLGYSMAKKFVEEGAVVLITGRDVVKLEQSSKEIGCECMPLDLTSVESFDTFLSESVRKIGGIDCLVNNAGISLHEESFSEVTPKSFDLQISTNFRGSFFLTQKFVNLLIANNKAGVILFISSETGEMADERPYGWTKAAINSMTQGLAFKLASKGFRINALAPGVTASEMTKTSADGNLYRYGNMMERIYLPEEVAETAAFLLSDASGCINGQIIACNNGKSINARWKKI